MKTIVVLSVLCAGCAGFLNPTAESVVSVRGTVAHVAADSDCNLRIFGEGGRLLRERIVPPVFRASITDAPGERRRYYVELSCVGQAGRFRSPLYERRGGWKEIDLGTIVLK